MTSLIFVVPTLVATTLGYAIGSACVKFALFGIAGKVAFSCIALLMFSTVYAVADAREHRQRRELDGAFYLAVFGTLAGFLCAFGIPFALSALGISPLYFEMFAEALFKSI